MKRKKLKIKVGDTVKVIAGSDKGVKAEVIQLTRSRPYRIKVRGVRMQTHFDKEKSQKYEKEGFIDYSNIALVERADKTKKESQVKKTAK